MMLDMDGTLSHSQMFTFGQIYRGETTISSLNMTRANGLVSAIYRFWWGSIWGHLLTLRAISETKTLEQRKNGRYEREGRNAEREVYYFINLNTWYISTFSSKLNGHLGKRCWCNKYELHYISVFSILATVQLQPVLFFYFLLLSL